MSDRSSDAADLIGRVTRLERRQRWLQPVAGFAAVATLAALAGFLRDLPDVVQAQRVELVTPEGRARAVLSTDSTGVVLTLFDKRGRASASLRLNGDPRLAVRDGSGREMAGLGAPRVQHLAE
jgi:hypothetical protein